MAGRIGHEKSYRLLPALLDRLTDDSREEPDDKPATGKAPLYRAIMRDLTWLLNSTQPLDASANTCPLVEDSVLNYGLPPLAGRPASQVDTTVLAAAIEKAIKRFEPRILAETLQVRVIEDAGILDSHNVIGLEIRGHVWAQPQPIEVQFRTQLDLETGKVEIKDLGAGASRMS